MDNTDKWKGIPLKERWKDPEWREFMSIRISQANKKGKRPKHSEETKRKIAQSIKKWHDDMSDEDKEKRIEKLSEASLEAYANDPTLAIRQGESLKQTYAVSPELRQQISDSVKQFYETDEGKEVKKEQVEKLKKFYSTPEGKELTKKRIEKSKEYHKGRKRSKQHRERMSDGISKAILEGRMGGYYTKSKRGHYHSSKVGEVYYRSAYELKAFIILDKDNSVVSYKHDSVRVPYQLDGIRRYYIIDLDISYVDGSRKLVEIKPKSFLRDKEVLVKIKAAQEKFGSEFEVWTEEELKAEDYYQLLEDLKEYLA